MPILAAILGLAVGVLMVVWIRGRNRLLGRIDALVQECERAELERSQLRQALSSRDHEETERLLRLEHDLRSSISGVVGFSSLLKESIEKDSSQGSRLLLKSANAIHQSATRTLNILDAATSGEFKQGDKAGLTVERER
jgi:signal transduction histidine kinase